MTTRTRLGASRTTGTDQGATTGWSSILAAFDPRIRMSIAVGVIVALVVAVLGTTYAAFRTPEWTAQTHLLVAPGVQADQETLSGYYETLSRGQVTATAAAIVDQPQFLRAARGALGLDEDNSVAARATVVSETSLVNVSVTAPAPRTAERLADQLASESAPEVNRLLAPYGVQPLESAAGSAERAGLSTPQLAALVAFLAVAIGVGTQQLIQHLTGPGRWRMFRTRT